MSDISPSDEYQLYKRGKARDYLISVRNARLRMLADMEEIAALRSDMDITGTFKYDGMPRNPSPSDDALLNAVCALDARCERLRERASYYERVTAECDAVLSSLTSHELAGIALDYHYLRGMKLRDLADKYHYSNSYMLTYIIGGALDELYTKMPTNYRDPLPSAI